MPEETLAPPGVTGTIPEQEATHEDVGQIIETYDHLAKNANARFNDLREALNNDHPELLPAFIDELIKRFGDEPSTLVDEMLGVRESAKNLLSPEAFAALTPLLDDNLREEVALRQHTEQHEPIVSAEYSRQKEQTLRTTNWDGVIKLFLDPQLPANRHDIYDVFREFLDPSAQGFEQKVEQIKRLEAFNEFLAENDLKKPESEFPPEEDGWIVHGNLSAVTKQWDRLNGDGRYYVGQRRKQWFSQHDPSYGLTKLNILLDNIDHAKTGQAPAAIAHAFERSIVSMFQEFDQADQTNLAHENETRPNMLMIQGSQLLTTTTGIKDVAGWTNERIARLPSRLTAGLGFVKFHKEAIPTGEGTILAGEMVGEDNRIVVDIREDFHKDLAEQKTDDKTRAAKQIGRTFDHELAHYMHANTLTFAELRSWQEALDAEPRFDDKEDGYTEFLEKNKVNNTRMMREQFAITFDYYVSDPLKVALDCPRRFAAMEEIVERYGENAHVYQLLAESIRKLGQEGETRQATQNYRMLREAINRVWEHR